MNRGAPLVAAILRLPMSVAAAVKLRAGQARGVEKRNGSWHFGIGSH